MTPQQTEALKMALEALEKIALAGMSGTGEESDEAMTAWHARQAWKFIGIAAGALDPIKEALAQPEQEPVAILNHAHGVHTFRNVKLKGLPDGEYLVYTHPSQRKPLTYCQECMRPNPIDGTNCAHGIKENT